MHMHQMSDNAKNWLSTLSALHPPYHTSPVKQDASLRVYRRIHDANQKTYILCQLDTRENFDDVISIQKAYETSQVNVPAALHWNSPWILFEDLGDTHLKAHLSHYPLDTSLQTQIIDQILTIQRISKLAICHIPTFDSISKTKEFSDIQSMMNATPMGNTITHVIQELLTIVLALPSVVVHKDFHYENLLVQNNKLYVLDYSDTMWGPPMYDLASLIADRGFYLSFKTQSHNLIDQLTRQLIHPKITPEHVWVSIALRLFKIIGNFERLSRTIRPSYRQYQKNAIETFKSIPWGNVLPKIWQPHLLIQIASNFP